MKFILVSVMNLRGDFFAPPQAVKDASDEDIVEDNRRGFLSAKVSKDNAKFLRLYKLGTFEDTTGEIHTFEKPVLLANCEDFIGGASDEVK